MKYTVNGFDQEKMIEFGMDNTDADILRWFIDFKDTGKMAYKIREDDPDKNPYFWIQYKSIIADLPILRIKNKEVIARRLKKLKVLESHTFRSKNGNYSCYRIKKEFYRQLVDKTKSHTTQKSTPPRQIDSKVDTPHDFSVDKPHDSKVGTKDPSTNVRDPSIRDTTLFENQKPQKDMRFKENIDEIYLSYPTKDENNHNRSTGKSSKNKDQIKRLIKTGEYSAEKLFAIQKSYLEDCRRTKTYIKNYGTFLNNIPDETEEAPLKDIKTRVLESIRRGRLAEIQINMFVRDGTITREEAADAVKKAV